MSQQILKRIQLQGNKRILALDGGGIKGALSLGFLKKIEGILEKRYNDDDFRLCNYFDLITGTSTGAIIASGLAIGMRVDDIKEKYLSLGKVVFGEPKGILRFTPIRRAKFEAERLVEQLDKIFGDIKLGGAEVKTGLIIFAKRLDTQSLWTLCNNPEFKYYETVKDLSLTLAIRASTAAPTYFRPVKIPIVSLEDDKKQMGIFTDGGISMANNPALMSFLISQIPGFGFNWQKGEHQLKIVSVGTGRSTRNDKTDKIFKWWIKDWAVKIPDIFMSDAKAYNEMLLQAMSNSPTKKSLDRVMGDLEGVLIADQPSFTYLRYDVDLDQSTLGKLGVENITSKILKKLIQMDSDDTAETLFDIGSKAAKEQLSAEHFTEVFDVNFR